jgi:hypothetical protein
MGDYSYPLETRCSCHFPIRNIIIFGSCLLFDADYSPTAADISP